MPLLQESIPENDKIEEQEAEDTMHVLNSCM